MAISPGSYDPQSLSEGDRQSLWNYFGHQGTAPVGYGGEGGGTARVDMSQVPSTQQYIQGQFAAEDPSLQALVERMGAREAPLDMYTRLEEQAELPALRQSAGSLSKEIANLEDSYYRLEPEISARTRESLVTEPQRQAMLRTQRQPITENLTRLGTSLGRLWDSITRGESTLGTRVGLGLQGQEMQLEPLELQYQTMQDRNARLLTGFTQDKEVLLQNLYDKLDRQRSLDDREWQKVFELEKMKQQYDYNISEYDYKRKNMSAMDIANSIPGFWD